jgi:DNA-binding NtrC family response regulator
VKRVLVIDDDRAVGGAIKIWLEIEGADVTYLADGNSGIEAIKAGDFDLLLIDIFMPGINGLDAIKAVHALKPLLPIIAMSGLICRPGVTPTPDIVDLATRSGAVWTLQKPFRPDDLRQAIETCLGGPLREPKAIGTETNG